MIARLLIMSGQVRRCKKLLEENLRSQVFRLAIEGAHAKDTDRAWQLEVA